MNYLFICTYNINRSKAAAAAFSELLKRYNLKGNVKNAGVSETAENRVSKELINWADRIYVMEEFHKDIITDMVPGSDRKIEVLGILDIYRFDDSHLKNILTKKLELELRNAKPR